MIAVRTRGVAFALILAFPFPHTSGASARSETGLDPGLRPRVRLTVVAAGPVPRNLRGEFRVFRMGLVGTRSVWLDREVEYELDAGTGRFDWAVLAPGYDPVTGTFEAAPGESVDLGTIELRSGSAVVEGRVLETGGRPAAGARVNLQNRTGRSIWSSPNAVETVTDADGRFTFQGVQAGDAVVAVTPHASRPWIGARRIHLSPGAPVFAELAPDPSVGSLRVRVPEAVDDDLRVVLLGLRQPDAGLRMWWVLRDPYEQECLRSDRAAVFPGGCGMETPRSECETCGERFQWTCMPGPPVSLPVDRRIRVHLRRALERESVEGEPVEAYPELDRRGDDADVRWESSGRTVSIRNVPTGRWMASGLTDSVSQWALEPGELSVEAGETTDVTMIPR